MIKRTGFVDDHLAKIEEGLKSWAESEKEQFKLYRQSTSEKVKSLRQQLTTQNEELRNLRNELEKQLFEKKVLIEQAETHRSSALSAKERADFLEIRLAIAEEKLLSSTTFRDVRILESPSEIQLAEKTIALQRLQEKLAVTHEQLIQSDYNLQRFKAISISTEAALVAVQKKYDDLKALSDSRINQLESDLLLVQSELSLKRQEASDLFKVAEETKETLRIEEQRYQEKLRILNNDYSASNSEVQYLKNKLSNLQGEYLRCQASIKKAFKEYEGVAGRSIQETEMVVNSLRLGLSKSQHRSACLTADLVALKRQTDTEKQQANDEINSLKTQLNYLARKEETSLQTCGKLLKQFKPGSAFQTTKVFLSVEDTGNRKELMSNLKQQLLLTEQKDGYSEPASKNSAPVVELRPTWQSAVNVLRREVDELSVGLLSATIEAEGGGGRSVAARVGLAPVALTDQRIDKEKNESGYKGSKDGRVNIDNKISDEDSSLKKLSGSQANKEINRDLPNNEHNKNEPITNIEEINSDLQSRIRELSSQLSESERARDALNRELSEQKQALSYANELLIQQVAVLNRDLSVLTQELAATRRSVVDDSASQTAVFESTAVTAHLLSPAVTALPRADCPHSDDSSKGLLSFPSTRESPSQSIENNNSRSNNFYHYTARNIAGRVFDNQNKPYFSTKIAYIFISLCLLSSAVIFQHLNGENITRKYYSDRSSGKGYFTAFYLSLIASNHRQQVEVIALRNSSNGIIPKYINIRSNNRLVESSGSINFLGATRIFFARETFLFHFDDIPMKLNDYLENNNITMLNKKAESDDFLLQYCIDWHDFNINGTENNSNIIICGNDFDEAIFPERMLKIMSQRFSFRVTLIVMNEVFRKTATSLSSFAQWSLIVAIKEFTGMPDEHFKILMG